MSAVSGPSGDDLATAFDYKRLYVYRFRDVDGRREVGCQPGGHLHLASRQHVARFLRGLLTATAPGGTIAILGPNFRYGAEKYILPFSFRSTLPPSPTLTATYLRLTPAWRLLGKQLLVLARKPRC